MSSEPGQDGAPQRAHGGATSPGGAPLLQTRALTREFSGFTAVDSVDLPDGTSASLGGVAADPQSSGHTTPCTTASSSRRPPWCWPWA